MLSVERRMQLTEIFLGTVVTVIIRRLYSSNLSMNHYTPISHTSATMHIDHSFANIWTLLSHLSKLDFADSFVNTEHWPWMPICKGITCTFVKMTIPLHLPQHIEFHIAGYCYTFSQIPIFQHTQRTSQRKQVPDIWVSISALNSILP